MYKSRNRLFLCLEGWKISLITLLENALNFIHEREHEDGGFTLYKGVPDTKNTYYGVKTFKMFDRDPFNKEKTIKWIQKLQNDRMFGIHGVFYRVNILDLFNKEIKVPESYVVRLKEKTDFVNLEAAYYHTIVFKLLEIDNHDIVEWIMARQNDDGGFGSGRSDILSTYYAVESLNNIDPSLIKDAGPIIEYTKDCQSKEGGFTYIPDIYPPYLEPTYSGVRIHEIMGIEIDNLENTMKFTQKLQNRNGGFRRSKYIGISELEYTYRALYILKRLYYL